MFYVGFNVLLNFNYWLLTWTFWKHIVSLGVKQKVNLIGSDGRRSCAWRILQSPQVSSNPKESTFPLLLTFSDLDRLEASWILINSFLGYL